MGSRGAGRTTKQKSTQRRDLISGETQGPNSERTRYRRWFKDPSWTRLNVSGSLGRVRSRIGRGALGEGSHLNSKQNWLCLVSGFYTGPISLSLLLASSVFLAGSSSPCFWIWGTHRSQSWTSSILSPNLRGWFKLVDLNTHGCISTLTHRTNSNPASLYGSSTGIIT